jgi:hypothetical protein
MEKIDQIRRLSPNETGTKEKSYIVKEFWSKIKEFKNRQKNEPSLTVCLKLKPIS